MKLESSIQKEIIKYLRTKCYVTKIVSASLSGVPDLICCHNGEFIAIELKRNKNIEPSALQDYNIKKIQENGGRAYVISSLQEAKEIIK